MRPVLLLASVAVSLSFVPKAGAVEMQPGLWQLTTKVDRDGTVSTRSPRSKCITAEGAKAIRTGTTFKFSAGIELKRSSPADQALCKVADSKNRQNLMIWQLRCTGSHIVDEEGSVRFDKPSHYVVVIKSRVTFQNNTFTTVTTTEGQRKGECQR